MSNQDPPKDGKIVISLFRQPAQPPVVQPDPVPPTIQPTQPEPTTSKPIQIQQSIQIQTAEPQQQTVAPSTSLIKLSFGGATQFNDDASDDDPLLSEGHEEGEGELEQTVQVSMQDEEDADIIQVPLPHGEEEDDADDDNIVDVVMEQSAPIEAQDYEQSNPSIHAAAAVSTGPIKIVALQQPPVQEPSPIQIQQPIQIQSQPIQIASSSAIQIGVPPQVPPPPAVSSTIQIGQPVQPEPAQLAEAPFQAPEQINQPSFQAPAQPALISIPLFQNKPPVPQQPQPPAALPQKEQESISPVKLRIGVPAAQQPAPPVKSGIIPIPLQPIIQSTQQPMQPQTLSPFGVPVQMPQMMQYSQPIQPTQPQGPSKLQVPLTIAYEMTHRQLAMKLDPHTNSYTAQLIMSFDLKPKAQVEEWLQTLEEYHKVAIEMKLIAKHLQITDMWELNGIERKKKFVFNDNDQLPENQAKVQQARMPQNLPNVADIEFYERGNFAQEQKLGTVQKKSKLFGLRPRKGVQEMLSKLKPQLRILVEYKCDSLTEGSSLRYVSYKSASENGKYFYTVDRNPECWMPVLCESDQQASPWSLRFAVPADYMVISSGVQTERLQDQQNQALHVYEVTKACADRIGFVCMKFPKITTIEQSRAPKGSYGCFVSAQKQQCFNQAFVVEVMEYLQNLLGVQEYPCRQIHLVFVPNLMAKKFPKQSVSFGEGLHIFDEQILMRPNQIDKRHHYYKHVAGALTFDFFGSKVREAKPGDLWLLTAVRERIGDRMKKKKCGMLLHKYQVMRSIEKLYKQMKHGAELAPLQYTHSSDEPRLASPDQALSDVFYRKCSLLMHMIESSIDEQTVDKIFRGIYVDALEQSDGLLSQFQFRKKFKKVCGMAPAVYYKNWVWATSCPELELSYEFNKRNNSLDLQLKQTSAVQYGQSEHQNLSQKLDRIFQSQSPASELTQPLDALFVDYQQAARRWFIGNINIVIYQIEGNGGDILSQQHKMSLKPNKSTTTSHIPLQGKVKRTMHNRKKEDQFYTIEQKMQNDCGQFKMNEFELEDYPQETKNIFQDLDSNPVLWIRVDPDMEFIRKIKIVQEKRNNWLFQLLRDQDIIGQIEAVRRLWVYNDELVYEILKTVANSENFFFKIRKEVLKTLRKMEIYTFNKFISHERFLLKMFNNARMLPGDSDNTFYRENDFTHILEYYMERYLLKAISKCKEDNLPLTSEKLKEVTEKMQQREKQVAQENGTQQQPDEQASAEPTTNANAICLPIIDSKVVRQRRSLKQNRFDESQYKCTTDIVSKMLMRVMEQNDNSENDFDDSFYLKDLIASLGRMDNVALWPAIATEIYRQFKLDQISNNSPHFAITIGSIKAYFNLRKQLFKFRTEKEINLDTANPKVQSNKANIEAVTLKLQEIKQDVDKLFLDPNQALHIRQFIFMEEVKNLFKFQSKSFAEALILVLTMLDQFQARRQLMFALYSLRDLVLYLEQKKFATGKLQMIDVYLPQYREEVKAKIWKLYVLPHAYLSPEFTYWTKRLIKRLYANHVPDCEMQHVNYDPLWSQTEQAIQNQQTVEHQVAQIVYQNPHQQADQVQMNYGKNQQIQPQQLEDRMMHVHQQERDRAQSFGGPQVASTGAIKIQIGLQRQNNVSDDEIMHSDISQGPDLDRDNSQPPSEGGNEPPVDDDESIIDPFADEKYDDPVMQCCWDVLGKIFYHREATDFLQPVTEESVGKDMYEEYCSVIDNPMDIDTVMNRMREDYYMRQAMGDQYSAKELFKKEVLLIFSNCKQFNARGTEIVRSAHKLLVEFKKLWHEKGLDNM